MADHCPGCHAHHEMPGFGAAEVRPDPQCSGLPSVTIQRLLEAARALSEAYPPITRHREEVTGQHYLAPAGSMVDAALIVQLRLALAGVEGRDG